MALYSTPEAAANLGISDHQFRRLVSKRRISPADHYINPHHRSGPLCPLWRGKDIGSIRRTNVYKEAQKRAEVTQEQRREREEQRRKERKKEEQDRLARNEERFGTDLEKLALASCQAMFELNRYAKSAECGRHSRELIYDAKGELIRILHDQRYCQSTALHSIEYRPMKCLCCDGSGEDDYGDSRCPRCAGSGFYRGRTVRKFVLFQFEVGGEQFSWHQPVEQIRWDFMPESSVATIEPIKVKPVTMSREELDTATELIDYYLELIRSKMPSPAGAFAVA